jgi:hypothetical protein
LKAARIPIPNCLDACRSTLKLCLRTGCWDSGTSRYCGLMKQ